MTESLPGRVTDAKALRALSHPTRWKLIELLGLQPTATATQCAEFTGESVASCSYHLGILAKYGFVEQADGGQGREKPWRSTSRRLSVSNQGLEPDAAMAAELVGEIYLDHELGRMKEHLRRVSRETDEWQRHTGTWSRTPHLTVDELAAAVAEFEAVLDRYAARSDDPSLRPEGARPVRMFLSAYLPTTSPHEQNEE